MAAAPQALAPAFVSLRHAVLVAVLALAPCAARAEGSVRTQATLHLRTTSTRDVPGTLVLFDRELRTFDVDGYLVPAGDRAARLAVRLASRGGTAPRRRSALGARGRHRRGAAAQLPARRARLPRLHGGVADRARAAGERPVRRRDDLPAARGDAARGAGAHRRTAGPLRDELEATLLLREAYAAWSFGKAGFATVRAGRKRTTIADGFVHDDYATGVELGSTSARSGRRGTSPSGGVPADARLPLDRQRRSRRSPRARRLPARRCSSTPASSSPALRDRTGSVAELAAGQRGRGARRPRSRARSGRRRGAGGAGARARALRAARERRLARLGGDEREPHPVAGPPARLDPRRSSPGRSTGSPRRRPAGRARDPRGGRAAPRDGSRRCSWETDLGERLSAGASFLYLSGGRAAATRGGAYDGFLGIAPFVTATNLFFGGGLSDTFAARQATAPGVNGRGVLAPGVSLSADPGANVSVRARAAWLRADVPGPYGGSTYGTEADLDVTWAPRPWLLVGAELDVLWPGDFYAGSATVYKTVLAVDLVTP